MTCREHLNHISWTACGVYLLNCTLALNCIRSNSSIVWVTCILYFHYVVISLLPRHGEENQSAVPSLGSNHQPQFIVMLTKQLQYRGIQKPIISKWALLDIWQHLFSYTPLPPLLLSLSAQRLSTEKIYSFIFKERCSHVRDFQSLFYSFLWSCAAL